MVTFFEVLFVIASIAMLWFTAYVIYRLLTEERL